MQRLQQQRRDAAHEYRAVAVNLADGAVCGEPAVSLRYLGPLARWPLPRPGDSLDDRCSDPPAKDVRDRHVWTTLSKVG